MRPSVYDSELEKDQVVEDRDQVKVVFGGGNVFYLHVTDVDKPETVRGANKAWERAEAVRLNLNPQYQPPAAPDGGENTDQQASEKADDLPEDKPSTSTGDNADSGGAQDGGDDAEQLDPVQETYVIAGVEGVMQLVDLNVLLDLVGDHSRVTLLCANSETRRLQARVRATDGRCAPVFFSHREGEEEIHLFSGLRTIAAAMNAGMPKVAMVILPADEIGKAQGAIVSLEQSSYAAVGDEEEMLYRAYND